MNILLQWNNVAYCNIDLIERVSIYGGGKLDGTYDPDKLYDSTPSYSLHGSCCN